MAEIPEPTALDLSLDLGDDYLLARRPDIGMHDDGCACVYANVPCNCGLDRARAGWPAALRLLAASRAERDRLRAALEGIAPMCKGKEPDHGWGTRTRVNDIWADGYRTACMELAAAVERVARAALERKGVPNG